ncbi:MAG: hypothetical protein SNG69_09220 [Rikenellaceae bacterium]
MKRILAILFAILSVSILLNIERVDDGVCGDGDADHLLLEALLDQSFSPSDHFVDLSGRKGSTTTFSLAQTSVKCFFSRRSNFDTLSGVRFAVASLFSICSYSRSCEFPFEHQPQRELFFTHRNIRI